jgi:hypothetical protein
MIEFRIVDEPKQKFSLLLNGRRVTFLLWFSGVTNRWSFDLSLDDGPVIQGRRIVTGTDLLAPFGLGIGVLFAFSETGAEPTRENLPLGIVKLYHTTQEEIDAAVAA